MTDKNLYVFQLEVEKQHVQNDIERFQTELRAQVDPDLDEADPGTGIKVVTAALLKNAQKKFEGIKHALEQAKLGGYGICEACKEAIDPERMTIFPQATLCVPCKSKVEHRTYVRAA